MNLFIHFVISHRKKTPTSNLVISIPFLLCKLFFVQSIPRVSIDFVLVNFEWRYCCHRESRIDSKFWRNQFSVYLTAVRKISPPKFVFKLLFSVLNYCIVFFLFFISFPYVLLRTEALFFFSPFVGFFVLSFSSFSHFILMRLGNNHPKPPWLFINSV